jgi:hypothetical protein
VTTMTAAPRDTAAVNRNTICTAVIDLLLY